MVCEHGRNVGTRGAIPHKNRCVGYIIRSLGRKILQPFDGSNLSTHLLTELTHAGLIVESEGVVEPLHHTHTSNRTRGGRGGQTIHDVRRAWWLSREVTVAGRNSLFHQKNAADTVQTQEVRAECTCSGDRFVYWIQRVVGSYCTASELSAGRRSLPPASEERHTMNQSRTGAAVYSVDFPLLLEVIKAVCSDDILPLLHADEFQALPVD